MRILSILTILMLGATAGAATPADWRQEDQEWREARLTRLRSPDGWSWVYDCHHGHVRKHLAMVGRWCVATAWPAG